MIRNIQTGDFVNQGRDKVNEAFGEIPVGFDIDLLTGDFVITKHNDEKIRVPLANFYATLANAAASLLPPAASLTQRGLVQLGDEANALHLESEDRVLPAAGVVRYVDSVIGDVPSFSALIENTVPVVRKKGNSLYVDFLQPVDFLKEQGDSYFKYICQRLSLIGCANGDTTPVEDIFEVTDLLRLVGATDPTNPTPVVHNYKAQADIISCDLVTGWLIDTFNFSVPGELDIFVNNELAGSVSATKTRKDVADAYGGNANSLYGFEFLVPAKYRVGIPLQIRVYVRDTNIEAAYGMSNTTAACGSTSPVPAPVYVVQNVLDGPGALYESGDELTWQVRERLSNGTERVRTDASDFLIVEGKPAGLTLTPIENGSKVKLKLTDIDFTKRVTLRAVIGNGYCEASVQLVDTTCYRPTGLGYKPLLVYASAPASGGDAHAFTTLDDAIESMRSHFDGSVPKLFTPFKAELAGYDDGTDVFLNWSPDDRSCAKTDDRIFYVLDGDGKNGQLIAIQVANGKIARSKRVPVNADKVLEMAVTCTALNLSQNAQPSDNVFDCFILWRVQGNPVVWVGTYIDGSTNPTYTGNGTLISSVSGKQIPAEWSRFTLLDGANTVPNYYRVRIVARLGNERGPVLVDYTFPANQRPFLPLTVYTDPSI